MTFKSATWFSIAALLSVVNVAAVWFAARPGEAWHATIHAALALAFGLWALRVGQGLRQAGSLQYRRDALDAEEVRLQSLESLDTEVSTLRRELSESQERLDFAERLLAQRPDVRRVEPERPLP